MNKTLITSMLAFSLAYSAGYKIPEQSTDSIGLAASNVAKSFGADAAYFNPANMPFLDDKIYFDGMINYFKVGQATFKGDTGTSYSSETYGAIGGTFHAVSNDLNGFRVGFSAYIPVGLEIEWKNVPQDISRYFKLNIIALNPSVAYAINDEISMAFGLNAYYIRGETSGEFYRFRKAGLPNVPSRHMKGDGWAFGYNIALAYKPLENLSFGLTYRSNTNLEVKGHAQIKGFPNLSAMSNQPNYANLLNYSGKARVKGLIIPASLVLGAAWDVTPDTTLLLAIERTFWSKLKGYDFEFDDTSARHNNALFFSSFDKPVNRNFKDSNTYRVGINHKFNQKWRGMLGFVYDEGAADSDSISFEIPDTKAYAYSIGLAYAPNENLEFGLGYIYQDRQRTRAKVDVSVTNRHETGSFKRTSIQIMGASVKYKF